MPAETIDPAHDTTSLLVAQLVSALALAVAVAAATVADITRARLAAVAEQVGGGLELS